MEELHSVTNRRTDGGHDDANSRSYCIAVRSAKNMLLNSSFNINVDPSRH